ncbi:hypothetical protein CRG98_047451 [Punica granatum]|uniref:Uncharacterized protein n=1 Tax=Punica granatum TaxID=22663 RepID=A0A2I0HKL7_PUNGR|nr:hypothetical protein CRG98_047451 [Punica granatum]
MHSTSEPLKKKLSICANWGKFFTKFQEESVYRIHRDRYRQHGVGGERERGRRRRRRRAEHFLLLQNRPRTRNTQNKTLQFRILTKSISAKPCQRRLIFGLRGAEWGISGNDLVGESEADVSWERVGSRIRHPWECSPGYPDTGLELAMADRGLPPRLIGTRQKQKQNCRSRRKKNKSDRGCWGEEGT